jgi:hypothetical protein
MKSRRTEDAPGIRRVDGHPRDQRGGCNVVREILRNSPAAGSGGTARSPILLHRLVERRSPDSVSSTRAVAGSSGPLSDDLLAGSAFQSTIHGWSNTSKEPPKCSRLGLLRPLRSSQGSPLHRRPCSSSCLSFNFVIDARRPLVHRGDERGATPSPSDGAAETGGRTRQRHDAGTRPSATRCRAHLAERVSGSRSPHRDPSRRTRRAPTMSPARAHGAR